METQHQGKNYYELLGVPQNASQEQIRKVYVDLSRIFHPDSDFYADIIDDPPQPKHIELFNAITQAFNVLSDEALRAEYDRGLLKNLPTWDEPDARQARAPKPDQDDDDPFAKVERSRRVFEREEQAPSLMSRAAVAEKPRKSGLKTAADAVIVLSFLGMIAVAFFLANQ